jgi:hypothetical protein
MSVRAHLSTDHVSRSGPPDALTRQLFDACEHRCMVLVGRRVQPRCRWRNVRAHECNNAGAEPRVSEPRA